MKSHKWKKWIMGYVIFMVLAAVILALSFSRLLSIGRRTMDSFWVCVLLILFAAAGMFLTSLIGRISLLLEKFSLREDKTSETNEKKKDGFLPPEDKRRQETISVKDAETREAGSVTKAPEKQYSEKSDSTEGTLTKEVPQEQTEAIKPHMIDTEPANPNDMRPLSVEEQLAQEYQKGTLMFWPGRKVLNIRPEYLNKTKLSYNTELEFRETNSSYAAFVLVEGKFVFPVGRYCERTYEECKNTFDNLHFGEIYDYRITFPHAKVKKIIPAEVVKSGIYYVVRKKGIIEMESQNG